MVSKIKVDEIESSQSGGTIDLNSSVRPVVKTTTEMNAITGMSAGDTIYNSTEGTLYVYNGYAWKGMSDNTFSTTVDYLIVAGGGGTGYYYGGGGGAGGVRSTVQATGGGGDLESAITFPSGTSVTVTVGAGGAAGQTGTSRGGSSSINGGTSALTVSTTGGGHGARQSPNTNPSTGGSGGGGTYNSNKWW